VAPLPFTEAVHFDETTGLAVFAIDDSLRRPFQCVPDPRLHPQLLCSITYITKLNEESGREESSSVFELDLDGTEMATAADGRFWIPVVTYAEFNGNFTNVVEALTAHKHPPGLIIQIEEDDEAYGTVAPHE
jgi:hypothetical protein